MLKIKALQASILTSDLYLQMTLTPPFPICLALKRRAIMCKKKFELQIFLTEAR